MNKVAFLPIETIARELDAKLLIALRLLEHDFCVIVGSKRACQLLAMRTRRGIYFNKDHSILSFPVVTELSENNISVVALDEEGLVWHSEAEYEKRIDQKTFDLCHKVFAWGPAHERVLSEYTSSSSKDGKIVRSGSPRVELLREDFREFQRAEAASLNIPKRSYILINAAFTAGNWTPHIYGTPSYVEHSRSRGKIKNKQDEEFYREKSNYAAKTLQHYLELIETVAKSQPDIDVVVRPHPDENHQTYQKLADHYENVLVRHSGAMSAWAIGADAVIYTGCTTGLESYLLGRPVIRFNPEPSSRFEADLPNQLGMQATSIEEFLEILDNCRKGQTSSEADSAERLLGEYLAYPEDGHDESQTIAEHINKVAASQGMREASKAELSRFALKLMFSATSARLRLSRVREVLFDGKKKQSARAQKFSQLKKSVLHRKLENLVSSCDDIYSGGVKISHVASNCYLISKD